jgi:hypothetical protein
MAIPKYVNISGDDTLVRDTFSMGVINTNTHALEAAKRAHAAAMVRLAEQRRKDQELNTLRTEVSELKQLVHQLLERK